MARTTGALSECCTQSRKRILFLGPPCCQKERQEEGKGGETERKDETEWREFKKEKQMAFFPLVVVSLSAGTS